MRANMRVAAVHCQANGTLMLGGLERTNVNEMMPATIQAIVAVVFFVGPFIALAVAALAFGVDSRPSIDDRGPHRWMPGA